ncbi:ribonuclease T2 family protein [Vibrio owensii]|uniref:ribonuclease T2 family protein n=1 Tax=Vibrio owensii TaxID=696485 RepID=UPI004068FD00
MKGMCLAIAFAVISSTAIAGTCVDPLDTYNDYNEEVTQEPNLVDSEFYVLSYSWAPKHCEGKDAQPGDKDYLQCHPSKNHYYVLHGLWPQGKFADAKNYPRACNGDREKIPRDVLNKYLCMTPSVWLLQHEFEYHGGACMPDGLTSVDDYFNTAQRLHSRMTLPKERLYDEASSYKKLAELNKGIGLKETSIRFYKDEWLFCIDNKFNFVDCPTCPVKGNINKKGKKLYFTESHPDYKKVIIKSDDGEQCFQSEEAAQTAGWTKA